MTFTFFEDWVFISLENPKQPTQNDHTTKKNMKIQKGDQFQKVQNQFKTQTKTSYKTC